MTNWVYERDSFIADDRSKVVSCASGFLTIDSQWIPEAIMFEGLAQDGWYVYNGTIDKGEDWVPFRYRTTYKKGEPNEPTL